MTSKSSSFWETSVGAWIKHVLATLAIKTPYVPIAIHVIAVIASFVVAASLLFPLLTQLFTIGTHQSGNGNSRRPSSSPNYSNYCLYLVYLAAIDLIMCIYNLNVIIGTNNDSSDQNPWNNLGEAVDASMKFWYTESNLLIGAVNLYQIRRLLQQSSRARRIDPPSLKRVSLEVVVILLVTIIVGLLPILREILELDASVKLTLLIIFWSLYVLMQIAPIIHLSYVTIWIRFHGHIPSTNGTSARDRALRELTIFRHILSVFVVTYLLYWGFKAHDISTEQPRDNIYVKSFPAIQAIVKTLLILRKADSKKYIIDFLTMSCLFSNKNVQEVPREFPNQELPIEPDPSAICDDLDSIDDSNSIDENNDSDIDGGSNIDVEEGIYYSKSRRIRAQPTMVLATGETLTVNTQASDKEEDDAAEANSKDQQKNQNPETDIGIPESNGWNWKMIFGTQFGRRKASKELPSDQSSPQYCVDIFDGTNAGGAFANFIYDEDTENDQTEPDYWDGCQDIN